MYMFLKCFHGRYLQEFIFQISVGEFLVSAETTLTGHEVTAADDMRKGLDIRGQSQTQTEVD